MNNITQERIIGFTGSAIFCGLLALLLYCAFLSPQVKAEEQEQEQGVLVNFGTVNWAAGSFEPRPEGQNRTAPIENVVNTPTETAPVVPVHNPPVVTQPPAITQNTEPTVTVDEVTNRKKEQERLEQQRLERQRREEEQRRTAINQQMQGAFGAGVTSGSSEGTAAGGSGNQGSEEGNAPTGSYTGVGGYGSFDLAGRSLGSGGLPRPAYSVQDEGKIVINITVDTQGNVLSADIGRGTNITNNSMRNSALEAARKAKFNAISGNNNQSGTITYRYVLK